MNTAPCTLTTAHPALALLGLVLSLIAAPLLAQGVYRSVGADGRVTFSDQPAAGAGSARPIDSVRADRAASTNARLPFSLRQVVERFPVTLYTSTDCAPCDSGRNLLHARGIPYTEKTVNTAQDIDALKRLSGASSLPLLTIGSQQIAGYSSTEWAQFLDAAGYPRQSALPAGYRRPAPLALVNVQPAAPAPAPGSAAHATEPTPQIPVAPPANNPAGIRF